MGHLSDFFAGTPPGRGSMTAVTPHECLCAGSSGRASFRTCWFSSASSSRRPISGWPVLSSQGLDRRQPFLLRKPRVEEQNGRRPQPGLGRGLPVETLPFSALPRYLFWILLLEKTGPGPRGISCSGGFLPSRDCFSSVSVL